MRSASRSAEYIADEETEAQRSSQEVGSGGLTPGLRSPHFTPNSISLSRDFLQVPAPGESDPRQGPLKPGAFSGARRPGQAWGGGKTRSPGQLVGVWTASPEAVGRQRGVQEAPPWHLEAPSHTWHQPCTGLPLCPPHSRLGFPGASVFFLLGPGPVSWAHSASPQPCHPGLEEVVVKQQQPHVGAAPPCLSWAKSAGYLTQGQGTEPQRGE